MNPERCCEKLSPQTRVFFPSILGFLPSENLCLSVGLVKVIGHCAQTKRNLKVGRHY